MGTVVKGDALVEQVFNFFFVLVDGVGDGAGPLGSGVVVGFEVGDEEGFGFLAFVEGFDGAGKIFSCVGVVFEGAEGVVDGGGVDAVVVVFVGEVVFVGVAGVFVDLEAVEEDGDFGVVEPVGDGGFVEVGVVGELAGAGGGEGVGVLGVFEEEVALGVPVVFGEGWTVTEVGVTVQECIELIKCSYGWG